MQVQRIRINIFIFLKLMVPFCLMHLPYSAPAGCNLLARFSKVGKNLLLVYPNVVQIIEYQSCPAGMSVVEWCACHDITKANYYYRLRRVRQACLENIPGDLKPQIVPVEPGILQMYEKDGSYKQPGLDICIKEVSIHVASENSLKSRALSLLIYLIDGPIRNGPVSRLSPL